MKKYFCIFASLSMMALSSCSSDSDDDKGVSGNGSVSVEDSKEALANTATEVFDMLQPKDQEEIFNVATDFAEMYGDLEFPSNFTVTGYSSATPEFFAALKNFSSGDYTSLSRAVNVYTYNIKYSELVGIYEPGTREWNKTGSSKDIIFRFNDRNNQKVELTVSATGTPYTYQYTEEDYWDNLKEVYNLECPRNVDVKLTCGGKTLVDGTTKTDVNVDGHKFSIDTDVTAANIRAIAKASGNDSKVTEDSEVRIDGKSVISTSATVNGAHLCDIDYIQGLDDDDDDDDEAAPVLSMFKNATAEADILGKIRVSADGKLTSSMINAMDYCYWDSYDYDSKAEALADCQKACNELNKNLNCTIKFDNDGKAPLVAEPVLWEDRWGDYWEYGVGVVIKFSDGSAVSVDDYFGRGFDSITRRYETLINSYRRAWGI